jgi:putative addiction module killer protein
MTDHIDNPETVFYRGQSYRLEQTAEFAEWFEGLRDRTGRARIIKRLVRLANGQFGDVKPVGEGVSELRMFFGPGFRVYFMQRSKVVILLLAGGDKDSQSRDIALAHELARQERDGTKDDPV